MAPDDQHCVQLHRSASGLVVTLADGSERLVPLDLIKRSKVLSNVISSTDEGESERFELPPVLFQAWLDMVTSDARPSGSDAQASISARLHNLKAADLLDDSDALAEACALLAAQAFPPLSGSAPDARPAAAEAYVQEAAAATEVVEALPEHLALLTLRTAIAAVPPRVPGHHHLMHPGIFANVEAWMRLLPAPLQPLILRALDPSADRLRTFSMDLPDLSTAAIVTETLARSFGTHLTSLALRASAFPASLADGGIPQAATPVGKAHIRRAIAPLATMTSLRRLHIDVHPGPGALAWADMFFTRTAAVLPSLQQLTELRVAAPRLNLLEPAAAVLNNTSTLRMLRSLDVQGFGIPGFVEAISQLATALPALTALTHLCLSNNFICTEGWLHLSPVVAKMKSLRALDLENCLFDTEFRFMPEDPSMQSTAFPALRTLTLSRSMLSAGMCEAALALPHLRSFNLTGIPEDARGLPDQDEERALLLMLAGSDSEDLKVTDDALSLQEFRFGPAGMQAPALHALCQCVERWADLRVLVLHCHGIVHNLFDTLPPLATRTGLREVELRCFSVECEEAAAPLAELTGLTRLSLGNMMCGQAAVAAVTRSISALTALQSLDVAYVGRDFVAETGVEFGRAVAPLTQLRRLSLRCCCLGRVGTRHLSSALACVTGLRELELEQNGMQVKAAATLAPALAGLWALSLLNLGMNPLGDAGAAAVAGVLPRMAAMRVLNMRECAIGESACEAVVRAAPPGIRDVIFITEPVV